MASEKKSPIGRRVEERSVHIYEVRPRKDKRGVALISDVLKYGAVWYTGPNAACGSIQLAWRDLPLTKIVRCEQDYLSQKFARLMKTHAQRRPKVVDLTKRARHVLKASINLVQQRWAKPSRLKHSKTSIHIYEIRPRADKRGFDLISDALPYIPLWYRGPNAIRDAIGYAKFFSRSHEAVIRVYDDAGNAIETHQHVGEFKDGELSLPPRRTRGYTNFYDSRFNG